MNRTGPAGAARAHDSGAHPQRARSTFAAVIIPALAALPASPAPGAQ